jgi:tetratricopeptide (TPR) repeat protein
MPHAKRRQNIEQMLEKTPNDPFLLYAHAMTFLAEGREDEVVSRLTALLQSHPDYHAAHLQIGQVLAARGEIEEAKSWFEQGSAIAARLGDMKAAGEMERFRDAL